MVQADDVYIRALERVLRKTDYFLFIKALRGPGDFVDPWYVFELMKKQIQESSSPYKKSLLLLQMGYGAEYEELAAELGQEDLEAMLASGIWRQEGERVETNNYVVLTYQGLALLTEINPWYETCTNPNTDVYIGSDSLRLAENIVFRRGAAVLDLCSGTGIQGLLAAKSARRVISVEMNERAVPVTRFNIRLNHLEDIVELRQGDLYDVLGPGEKFDFIYANPPFIPMVDKVSYPLCGAGGEDGRLVLDRIVEGLPRFLRPGGEVIIFCECLGNEKEVFFDKALEKLLQEQQWRGLCLRCGRLAKEFQIEKLASLTKLFNETFDEENFKQRMEEVYDRLGAKFLYNLIYKILAEPGKGTEMLRIDQCSPWTEYDGAEVQEGITVGDNQRTFGLYRHGCQISSISRDTRDVLALLGEGKSLGEITLELHAKHQAQPGRRKETRAAMAQRVQRICLQMEKIGAIARKPAQED